ncbi:MAG: hypothetical protein WDN28_24645 [Chthoniobacter sp.]
MGGPRGPNADFSNWDIYLTPLRIQDPASFVLVAYIHNASYLGGATGLVLAASWLGYRRFASHRAARIEQPGET